MVRAVRQHLAKAGRTGLPRFYENTVYTPASLLRKTPEKRQHLTFLTMKKASVNRGIQPRIRLLMQICRNVDKKVGL